MNETISHHCLKVIIGSSNSDIPENTLDEFSLRLSETSFQRHHFSRHRPLSLALPPATTFAFPPAFLLGLGLSLQLVHLFTSCCLVPVDILVIRDMHQYILQIK